MAKKKANIEIIINIDGKRHEMSMDDARKLYNDLEVFFGPKTTVYPNYPYPRWNSIGNTSVFDQIDNGIRGASVAMEKACQIQSISDSESSVAFLDSAYPKEIAK